MLKGGTPVYKLLSFERPYLGVGREPWHRHSILDSLLATRGFLRSPIKRTDKGGTRFFRAEIKKLVGNTGQVLGTKNNLDKSCLKYNGKSIKSDQKYYKCESMSQTVVDIYGLNKTIDIIESFFFLLAIKFVD